MTDDAQRALDKARQYGWVPDTNAQRVSVEVALLEVTRHWADTIGVPQQVIVAAVENVLASERRVQEKQP